MNQNSTEMIPLEVAIEHLFPFLDQDSFIAWSSTCKEFRAIWKSDYFYKKMMRVHGRIQMKEGGFLSDKDMKEISCQLYFLYRNSLVSYGHCQFLY